jgi:N-acetylmuramoyl-L-alanine amidase
MANSSAHKSLKQKRGILKEVYADNLNRGGASYQLLNRHTRLTSKRLSGWPIRYAITFLVLLAFSTVGVFFLHPQALRAIGLGWPDRNLIPQVSNAFVGPIDMSQRPNPNLLDAALPARQDGDKERDAELKTGGDPTLFNSPQDYSGLVGPMPVSIAELFDLRVRTIAIDPGHGGRDPGAIGPSGLKEKDLTLDIARRLRDRLEKNWNHRILLTRDRDVNVSLKRRVEFVNENGADLFISIHVNYIPVEPVMIIETYFFGAQADEEAMRTAEKENQGSEYVMAEFRAMIEKISDNFKQQESRSLALSIQESLFRSIRNKNARTANRGIKSAPFVVLLGADMPSVLAEATCISNKKEEEKLADPAYREEIAGYLEVGIAEYLEKSKKEPIKGGKEYVKKG